MFNLKNLYNETVTETVDQLYETTYDNYMSQHR